MIFELDKDKEGEEAVETQPAPEPVLKKVKREVETGPAAEDKKTEDKKVFF